MNKQNFVFLTLMIIAGSILGMERNLPMVGHFPGHVIIEMEPPQQIIPGKSRLQIYKELTKEIYESAFHGPYEPAVQGALVCCLLGTALFCCQGTAAQKIPCYYEASGCCAATCGLWTLCLGVCAESDESQKRTIQGALASCVLCTGLFCCGENASQIIPHYYEISGCCAATCGLYAMATGVCSEPSHYKSKTKQLLNEMGKDTCSALQVLGRIFCCKSLSKKDI